MTNHNPLLPHQLSVWPTQQQGLLLTAALHQGQAALAAWRAWRSMTDINQLAPGSFHLLPLLYRNLQQQAIQDAWMDKLKGIHHWTWVKNQVALEQIGNLVGALETAGIRPLLLKGVPLSLLYYPEPGLRPLHDLELMVPPDQVAPAVALLQAEGWLPNKATPQQRIKQYLMCEPRLNFKNTQGVTVNLHGPGHVSYRRLPLDKQLWQTAHPFMVHNTPTHTLNPTDQLLYVCTYGRPESHADVTRQWIPDALFILRAAAAEIDWARLQQVAQQRALTLRLLSALRYLQQTLAAPMPSTILQQLAQTPLHSIEKLEDRISHHSAGSEWPPVTTHWMTLSATYLREHWFPVYLTL